MPKWIAALLALALLSFVALLAARRLLPMGLHPVESLAQRADEQPLEKLWPAPEFAYPDQHGKTLTRAGLRGKVWVASFIFTQCRTVCPLLTAKMVQLQRRLRGVDARFVSFSVDPAHDTPEVLAAYARKWAADEERWSLLSTDAKTLPRLAAEFHVTAQAASSPDALDPILHSTVFLVVDAEGWVRGAFDSEHAGTFAALERAVRALAPAPQAPPQAEAPRDPESQYHALGCASCHEDPSLAPSLRRRAQARRELESGLVATYDAAYVRESLLAPDAKRVRGYPLRMPSYDGLLDEPALSGLTQWLLTLPGLSDETLSEGREEEDPVCRMKVRVTADTPSVEREGRIWHFCSALCRERFAAAPSAFIGRGQSPSDSASGGAAPHPAAP